MTSHPIGHLGWRYIRPAIFWWLHSRSTILYDLISGRPCWMTQPLFSHLGWWHSAWLLRTAIALLFFSPSSFVGKECDIRYGLFCSRKSIFSSVVTSRRQSNKQNKKDTYRSFGLTTRGRRVRLVVFDAPDAIRALIKIGFCTSTFTLSLEKWRENLGSPLFLLSGSFPGVRYATKPTKWHVPTVKT